MLWVDPVAANPNLVDELAGQLKPQAVPALRDLADRLSVCDWHAAAISAAFKETLAAHQLKMPQLAVPVRLKVFGRAQTPSVDAMLALMPRDIVLSRLRA
jgi:glutamyl-tRNA synthetase